MRDWLEAIPNLGVPSVPGVQPQKSATFSGTPHGVAGVPGVPERPSGTPGTPTGTPDPYRKMLKSKEEHREHREHRKYGDGQQNYPVAIWRGALAGVNLGNPLHGLAVARWRQLLGDAQWVLDHFAQQAAVDGWTAGELFGLWLGKDGWGGIADRLRGSRSLVMTDDRARWRTMFGGVAEQFNRGAYRDLRSLWEAAGMPS